MEYRKDEPPRTWFRSDRVFRVDGQWFFHTREGIAVGPYKTRFEAEIDAGMLKCLLADADQARAKTIIREFMLYSDSGPAKQADMSDTAYTDYVIEESGENAKPSTA